MRLMSKSGLAAALLLGLGACTTALPPEKVEAIGPPFNDLVKDGYVQLASAQLSDADYWAYRHFRGKARSAMLGDTVWPDRVGSRKLPPPAHEEALPLRERLVTALESTARERVPAEAASAQVNFDCWLEELASGAGPDAALCRDAFLAALERTEVAAIQVPDTYQVLFERGRTALDAQDIAMIDEAARAAQLVGARRIDVTGYADPTGSPSVNQALSQRRAEAVAAALVQSGVAASAVQIQGAGAAGQPDSPEARRVVIVIVR